jgi:hypothetical protein
MLRNPAGEASIARKQRFGPVGAAVNSQGRTRPWIASASKKQRSRPGGGGGLRPSDLAAAYDYADAHRDEIEAAIRRNEKEEGIEG